MKFSRNSLAPFILVLTITLATFIILCQASNYEENLFKDFLNRYNKKYAHDSEYDYRYKIFLSNLQISRELQARNPKAQFGVTKFMDLSPEEFQARFLNTNHSTSKYDSNFLEYKPMGGIEFPANYDWRTNKTVTPVYDQGSCGSCWAFCVTENIETQRAIAGNPLIRLSMQQMIDCDNTNKGCSGGEPVRGYNYAIRSGLQTYDSYPYQDFRGVCLYNPYGFLAHISSGMYVTTDQNERVMQEFVYTSGAPSVAVDAVIWQTYQKGVITSSSGCGVFLNHCVQITGWRREAAGDLTSWVVRNEWGTDWGEEGYVFVEMGRNVCGIASSVTTSIV